MFREYAEHGWLLVPIAPGEKGPSKPGWNRRDRCISNPLAASRLKAAGLAHAYSGTCALDLDDVDGARTAFRERGIDLDALLTAPDAVRIDSGRPNRAKLLYRLNDPLPTKQIVPVAAQLRCATADGLTVQDVLPPSPHPTGSTYAWLFPDQNIGAWARLPAIPAELGAWWRELVDAPTAAPTAPSAAPSELAALIARFDPDCGYDEWLRVGMAIHHETGGDDEGLDLWDAWSQKAAEKYKGRSDLEFHWRSFGSSDTPVTAGSLRREQAAAPDEFPIVDPGAPADDPWAAADAERAARFEPVHGKDWANRPPPEWLVKGVLPQQDLAMMRGAPGTGKSFLALDMAMAIAGERDWNGRDTKHGAVAWIAAEAAGSMRNRLRAYAQGHDVQLAEHDFWVIGETPDLSDAEQVAALMAAAGKVNPTLIVVDTLSAASGGANENSGEDMNAILAACRALHRATGALVVLVHHTGKDASKGARGWSGLTGAMHTEIAIETIEGTKARIAKIEKQRDGEAGIQMPFQLVPVSIGLDGTTSCMVDHFAPAQLAAVTNYAAPIETAASEPHFASLLVAYGGVDEIECVAAGDDEFNDLLGVL